MRILFSALVVSSMTALAAPALAADASAEVMAAMNSFNDNMNKGDVKAAVAVCASPAFIIDEFPPHTWHGKNACSDWASALEALNKKKGDTDLWVTFSKPWHVAVEGDNAYAVIPVKLTFKENGKPMAEDGSILTAALHKEAAGWKITAWTWSQH
ncbi:MAG TPA: nuclear transport factor 2 family protein [Rhizomicrobium sp.]|nr:nuclear transport factor 2 family protein [Rhizomicrobium sp.]